MSNFTSLRPIIIRIPKSTISESIAAGGFGSVHTVNLGNMHEGQTTDYICRQINIQSTNGSMTSWVVAFFLSSAGFTTDADTTTITSQEDIAKDAVTPVSSLYSYSSSGMQAMVKATIGSSGNTLTPNPLQINFAVGVVGGSGKSAGAGGYMLVEFWLEPLPGV